ncbi:MAG: tetratricopeptide repeat protein [Bacteroidales bacterium]|nr:tetratricopeptide repeat protein [Bacteroidales bacterium]
MKRLFIALAVVLISIPQINAQSKEAQKALKELEKAKAAVEKKGDAASYVKLGNAYSDCFDGSIFGIFLGNTHDQSRMLMKGQVVLSSEQEELNGKTFNVDKYLDKNVYYGPNNTVVGFKLTKPLVPGENLLDKSMECYNKAIEKGALEKDMKPLINAAAQRYWQSAMSAYALGDYKDACIAFENSFNCKQHPMVNEMDKDALIYAGFAAVLAKESKKAIEIFERCRTLDILDGDVYAYLADSYKAEGDTVKCKELLNEGFEKFPTNQGILVSLINTYLETNDDPNKIINVIHKAQENEPNNASLFYAEGNLYKNMKDYDKAIALYRKSAELNPNYVYAPFNEGDLYYQMALDLQDKANAELDDKKYDELQNQMNDCLKKAIEPFERAFNIAEDKEIKTACAQYLKQIFFRFREESAENQANYEKYNKFVEENSSKE